VGGRPPDWPPSGAEGAEGDDLSVVCGGDSGHGDGRLMTIQSDIKRARLGHG
jgi:hypothetical protein